MHYLRLVLPSAYRASIPFVCYCIRMNTLFASTYYYIHEDIRLLLVLRESALLMNAFFFKPRSSSVLFRADPSNFIRLIYMHVHAREHAA